MRVALIITARPSYAKAKTVIAALLARQVDVQVICAASSLLERYGRIRDVIENDFPTVPITDIWSTYEGATLITSAKETGALLTALPEHLSRLSPDVVVVIADRHEVLAAAMAVKSLHVPLVHVQGGEHSGSIDDAVRDAVTQLADVHLVATERAKYRVYGLTGSWAAIHHVGCPSIDLAHLAQTEPPVTAKELGGAGVPVNLSRPFVCVLQHPVTSEATDAAHQMRVTLDAAETHGLPVIVFWPGQDAGNEAMAKAIRLMRGLHTVRNLAPTRFLRLLTQASCLIGNSSAGIRECSYLGVPVVNVGSRQDNRERGPNVIDVPSGHPLKTVRALYDQVTHGRYPSSDLYGQGDAGTRIADVLCR